MMKRFSPVSFESHPLQTEMRGDWEVVLAYKDQGAGLQLVDLSHISKWDIQSVDISQVHPLGVNIPGVTGACTMDGGMLINRMNRTQASVWHLSGKVLPIPAESAYTDITESLCLVGVLGQEVFSLMEKMSALDLQDCQRHAPILVQGPVLHVTSQVVVLGKDALLIGFSRGFAQSVVEAMLDAGQEWGIQPAGELAFSDYVQRHFG